MPQGNNERTYLWITQNPLGTPVGLTNETYNSHIIDDHPNDKAREFVNTHVMGIIEQPRFIYLDNEHTTNKRVRYMDYVRTEEYGKFHNLVIVVETDRVPNEIVTWSVKSSTRQEKGEIIYDSRKDSGKPN